MSDRRPAIAVPLIHARPEPPTLWALWRRLRWASQRYRQRRALAELDDRLLADLGLTRAQVEEECRKPPWR